jgi:peptidoglycan/xylan/chitin deacetylase (PgdA/CDA1 family)
MRVLPELRILMYHSIADNPKDIHAIWPDEFDKQMAELSQQSKRGEVKVVGLMEGIRLLREGKAWRGLMAITFDDALRDFLLNAVPVLKKYDLPATMFVPTNYIGGTAEWDSYDKSKPIMTWDELAEVSSQGFDIASHTLSHPRLINCDSQQLDYELSYSMETIHSHIPNAVPLLSYPGGFYGKREMQAAEQAGYVGCVGVSSRLANYPWTNRFRLRRRKWAQ